MCKKQCEMREIHLQKSPRKSLKNTENCHTILCKFSCEKHWKTRQIYMQEKPQNLQETDAFCSCFLHTELTHFAEFFCILISRIRTVFCP